MKKGASYFTKIIGDNKETNENSKKVETIFYSKKRQKKALYKKKKICGLYQLQLLVYLYL